MLLYSPSPFPSFCFFAPEPALFHTNNESEQHRAGGLKASGFGRHPRNAKAQSQRNPRLAPKVKGLAIEVGGTIVKPNLEVEWATGAVWLDGRRVSSGLGTSQWNTNQVAMSNGAERVGEGWVDIKADRRDLENQSGESQGEVGAS